MKRIIEIEENDYELSKADKIPSLGIECRRILVAVRDSKPYNPTGDLISREDLKQEMKIANAEAIDYEMLVDMYEKLVDNAPTVPLPNEQIAWEQGYEAGLAQGKQNRPQGEWIENKGKDIRDHFYTCSICGRTINVICGETLKDYPFCHCGADMRGGDNE